MEMDEGNVDGFARTSSRSGKEGKEGKEGNTSRRVETIGRGIEWEEERRRLQRRERNHIVNAVARFGPGTFCYFIPVWFKDGPVTGSEI